MLLPHTDSCLRSEQFHLFYLDLDVRCLVIRPGHTQPGLVSRVLTSAYRAVHCSLPGGELDQGSSCKGSCQTETVNTEVWHLNRISLNVMPKLCNAVLVFLCIVQYIKLIFTRSRSHCWFLLPLLPHHFFSGATSQQGTWSTLTPLSSCLPPPPLYLVMSSRRASVDGPAPSATLPPPPQDSRTHRCTH